MALKIYDNKIGFRPSGDVLKYWVMLPQVTTSIGGEQIPSLFGNLKGVAVPIMMTILLVIVEGILIFQLNEEGVGFLAILGISIFDFIVAILPAIILMKSDLLPAQIDANIFVNRQKIRISAPIPGEFNDNKEKYNTHLKDEIKEWIKKRMNIALINWAFIFAIILLNVWKFVLYYDVLGTGIFIEPIGRFILTVILLSIIVHILFTKIVYLYWRFRSGINKQLKIFKGDGDFKILPDETNKFKELEFKVKYKPVFASNQRIAQKLTANGGAVVANDKIIELEHDDTINKYRVSEFSKDMANVELVYTGLLTDAEIQGLYTTQQDATVKKAVVASCKETQLSQLING